MGQSVRIVRKSVAYITRGGRVLFFRAKELPGSGAELPGGTLLPEEEAANRPDHIYPGHDVFLAEVLGAEA